MPKKITRKTQLLGNKDIREALLKKFHAIDKGFIDQGERADTTMDYWDLYNCKLGQRQFYAGNSRLFLPLVHNAVEARKTRFVNQMFPETGRYIDVTSEDDEIPHAEMALLELYVERAQLRTRVMPALCVSGDVEGQYSLLVTWGSRTRHSVSRETSPLVIAGIEHPELGDITTIEQDTFEDAGPEVEIIADADLLILPQTADSVEQALDMGGSVTVVRRYTKEKLEEMIADDELDEKACSSILEELSTGNRTRTNTPKKLAELAGIREESKFAVVYRTWAMLEVDGKRRLCLAYYGGGDDQILSVKLCPYWCDKPDILSAPVKKMPNLAKGIAPVAPCADMQYAANDVINEGMDSATYGLLPVIMTDPEKNPRVGSMVMDLMSVWETSPNDTKVLQFPALYKEAFEIVGNAATFINQTLSVTPAMMPQSTGRPGQKRNQAEVNLEQQVDLLSTADAVTVIENSILTPLVERFAEYDAQYRDMDITIRSMGELGLKAEMVRVPPIQMGKRWKFRWFGVEMNRTVQQVQQKIAYMNVLQQWSQNPAVQKAGYEFDPIPVLRDTTEAVFGPRKAPQIFKSTKEQMALAPDFENELLAQGFEVPVSPMDNDPEHIQKHTQAMGQSDAHGMFRMHIQGHQQQMKVKQMASMMQQMQQQVQQPGGQPPAGRGIRPPRPGAQPGMPRGGQQMPGAIHRDRMPAAGAIMPPRKV